MAKSNGFIALALVCAGIQTLTAQHFKTLVGFHGSNGAVPSGGFQQGFDGNLYSTTAGVHTQGGNIDGMVFTIAPDETFANAAVLKGFPVSAPTPGTDGNLYGTTTGVPFGLASIYKLTPEGAITRIYVFCKETNCPDGFDAYAPPILAADGNFYGTTEANGANGGGTVYKVTPDGALTSIYNFCSLPNCADGAGSLAPLFQGTDGNFYGTTTQGGNNTVCPDLDGCGTVFKITPAGALTTLYTFCATVSNCPDSAYPMGGLIQATDGNFYGITQGGGSYAGQGTIFKIAPDGTFSTFYAFCLSDCSDGLAPAAGVIQGTDGALYGTTTGGGSVSGAGGTVFRITLGGSLTVLHAFCATRPSSCPDGSVPTDPLFQATDGSFYGTTTGYGDKGNTKFGTAFRISTDLKPFVIPVPPTGMIGSTVTILGNGLTEATSVAFAGVSATFVANATGSAITAVVPSGATAGEIRVAMPKRVLKSNVPFSVSN